MDNKLIEKDSFKVIVKTKKITTKDGENFMDNPIFEVLYVSEGLSQVRWGI